MPTGIAVLLALAALLMPTVGLTTLLVEGSHIEARGNPLYWLILSMPALWAWHLMDHTPAALHTIRPGLFATPLIAGGVLALAAWMRVSDTTSYWIMRGVTCILTLAGGLAYNRSLLVREGPGA